jgi:hypothetical protein
MLLTKISLLAFAVAAEPALTIFIIDQTDYSIHQDS